MSVDRSLKSASALTRHRNVLSRAERLEVLEDVGHWSPEKDSVFGLTKVAHRKSGVGKKVKKETEETAAEPAENTAESPK